MTNILENKLALIIGSTSLIGLATAELFAKNGAHLALVESSSESRIAEVASDLRAKYTTNSISTHIFDLSFKSEVDELFEEVKKSHPNFDCPTILVTTPLIQPPKNFLEIDEKDYDESVNINLKGTFLVTQGLIKRLRISYPLVSYQKPTDTYASIVNVASTGGKFGDRFSSHYGLVRSQLETFTKSIAKECGEMRIRCNSVWPAMIAASSLSPREEGYRSVQPSETALKRAGRPDEVAQLILFLASGSSSFLTGTSIDIDGGL